MKLAVILLSSLFIYLLSCFIVSKIFAKAKIKKGYAYIPIVNIWIFNKSNKYMVMDLFKY